MDAPSLIVVDDNKSVRDALRDYLGSRGFDVRTADSGSALDQVLRERRADLIILDLMMPGEDGLSICRRLAAGAAPILMLSAMGETSDKVIGLELGAADYIAKPFEPRELLARIRSVLRTRQAGREPTETGSEGTQLLFEGWMLDGRERDLRAPGGDAVPLTPGEFDLLWIFAKRPNRLMTRDLLLELTRGVDAQPFDRVIDLTVSRLRAKLAAGGGKDFIQTVRGEGYRFCVPVTRT